MADWVVVLEYAAGDNDPRFELRAVQALVERLSEWHPSGLYDPNRYAIQLHVSAAGADEALLSATSHHDRAARVTGPLRPFTRAEVLTEGEFEESWHDEAGSSASRKLRGAPTALISMDVYQATRDLLTVSTEAEVIDILVRFVVAVGGRVNVGQPRHVSGMVAVDMGVGRSGPLQAIAENFSVAGLIIERWLPPLIDDAQRTVELLENQT